MALFCPDAMVVGTLADWVVAGGTMALFAVAIFGPIAARRRAEAEAQKRATEQARRALAGRADQIRELHLLLHDRSTTVAHIDQLLKVVPSDRIPSLLALTPLRIPSENLDRLPEDLATSLIELENDIKWWNDVLSLAENRDIEPVGIWDGVLTRAYGHLLSVIENMQPFLKYPLELPHRHEIIIPFSRPRKTQASRPPGMPIAEYLESLKKAD